MSPWLLYCLAIAASLVPILLTLAWLVALRRAATRDRISPLTAKLLRPAGESTRLHIQELGEQFDENLMILFFGSFLLGFSILIGSMDFTMGVITGAVTLGLGLWQAVKLPRLSRTISDYRLGFAGERAVGEELNQLLADGWRVFHDVPFDENPGGKPFNVDHVVLGPGGIYVVETKTRRKLARTRKDAPPNEVTFDGRHLHYPWGPEPYGIEQARAHADFLKKWLERSLKRSFEVRAILALPGWRVHRRAKSDVHVVSGREIASVFRDEYHQPRIDPQDLQAAVALIEQRNRDVRD